MIKTEKQTDDQVQISCQIKSIKLGDPVPKLSKDKLTESIFFIYKKVGSEENEFQAVNWSKEHCLCFRANFVP